MSSFYASTGEDIFDYLPLTFHIQNGLDDDSWYKFLKYYYKKSKEIKTKELEGNNNLERNSSTVHVTNNKTPPK